MIFFGSSKKLVYTLRRSLYKKERGSVEEIPTNLKSELHDGLPSMKILFCRFFLSPLPSPLSPSPLTFFLFSFHCVKPLMNGGVSFLVSSAHKLRSLCHQPNAAWRDLVEICG